MAISISLHISERLTKPTPLEGMATDQSAANLLSTCPTLLIDAVPPAAFPAASVGSPVPTHIMRVLAIQVRWKLNEGEEGSGEGMVM